MGNRNQNNNNRHHHPRGGQKNTQQGQRKTVPQVEKSFDFSKVDKIFEKLEDLRNDRAELSRKFRENSDAYHASD